MGMVFGKICVETPKFEVIQSTSDYEVRKYPPCVVAQITYDPSSEFRGNPDGGFSVLANYIGVLGQPQNTKTAKIAMTTPVITRITPAADNDDSEKIAMTAPVLTTTTTTTMMNTNNNNNKLLVTMQFVLPSKYTKAEEAPMPTDERVVIKEEAEGERKYGVVRFSGVATDTVVEERVNKLKNHLERDGFKVVGEFLLARYNPPWTLPPFRTNEIMIPIE